MLIGATDWGAVGNFFDGCLDSIEYVDRAKAASEILNEATLVTYLPFDDGQLLDRGPLLINGTGMNFLFTPSGRVGSALQLLSNWSYVQVSGLRRLGTSGWPYTMSIWINPSNLTGGTILHQSFFHNGGAPWCFSIMTLTASGQIVFNSWNNSLISLIGPSAVLHQWTHVAATYSSINGLRLYIDGFQYGSSSPLFTYTTPVSPITITLGSSLLGAGWCTGTHSAQLSQYRGLLDEFRVYARELTPREIWALANPS